MTHKRIFFLALFLLASCSLLLSQYAYKPFYPYFNFFHGAKSLSLANAFTAVADDLTTVFRNPAGIAYFLSPRFQLDLRSDSSHYSYESQAHELGSDSLVYDWAFVSKLKNVNFISIFAPAHFWGMRWSFALSYRRHIPYGFSGSARQTLTTGSGDRQKTTVDFSGRSGIDVLGFSAAVFLLKRLTFGVTLQQFFNSGTIAYHTLAPGAESHQEYSEKLDGRSLVFGLLFSPIQDVNIGAAYHTPLANRFHSDASGQQESSRTGDIVIPAKFALGISARLIKYLSISYEFSKILWSRGKLDDMPFPVRTDFLFDQNDIVNQRLGIEGNIPLKKATIFVRTGLSWERQLFPDADGASVWLKGYACGAGIRLPAGLVLDLAYMHQRGRWPEAGYFDPAKTAAAAYKNNIFALSLAYIFIPKRPKRSIYQPVPRKRSQ